MKTCRDLQPDAAQCAHLCKRRVSVGKTRHRQPGRRIHQHYLHSKQRRDGWGRMELEDPDLDSPGDFLSIQMETECRGCAESEPADFLLGLLKT